MPTTTASASAEDASIDSSKNVIEIPAFSLESYISRYSPDSETRLLRLLFIAEQTANSPTTDESNDGSSGTSNNNNQFLPNSVEISKQAYKLAERHMKEHGKSHKYWEVFGDSSSSSSVARSDTDTTTTNDDAMSSSLGGGGDHVPESSTANLSKMSVSDHHHNNNHDVTFDETWFEDTRRETEDRLRALQERYRAAKAHVDRPGMRSCLLGLGEFYAARGRTREALRSYHDATKFTVSDDPQTTMVELCLVMARLAVDANDMVTMESCVRKAERHLDNSSGSGSGTHQSHSATMTAKVNAALALMHLHTQDYQQAALKFAAVTTTTTTPDLLFPDLLSSEDVALYGTLTALASLDRPLLRAHVLDSPTFQQRLELVPTLRDALRCLARADYGRGLDLLRRRLQPSFRLDLHLHRHVPSLVSAIVDRCMVEYFWPFSAVCLKTMGESFDLDVDEMEEVVERLITDGSIVGAKINGKDGTLVRKVASDRGRVIRRIQKMGDQFLSQTENMILRLSYQEHNSSERRSGSSRYGGSMPMYEEGSSDDEDVTMMDAEQFGGM